MGKKSKSKAAKSTAIVPAASSGGGGTSSKKNARCFNCRLTVRVSEGKGHQCPGCSEIYCWRCESRFLACPNGDDCVKILRRCMKCCKNDTMFRAYTEAGMIENADELRIENAGSNAFPLDTFWQIVEDSDKLTIDAVPIVGCGIDGCLSVECRRCFDDPMLKSLMQCSECTKVRCLKCASAFGLELTEEVTRQFQAGFTLEVSETLRTSSTHSIIPCSRCRIQVCNECMSTDSIRRIVKRCLVSDAERSKSVGVLCDTCYWKTKPCTNPTCPNPIGIPTKRCGGCHISRYCSVECQAMAYPDHQTKCERMQVKLATRLVAKIEERA